MVSPTDKFLLDTLEKRFTDRIDALEILLERSITANRELYENKLDNLEAKMDSLQKAICSKEKEVRQNKFTLWIALFGWFVTTGVSIFQYIHTSPPGNTY